MEDYYVYCYFIGTLITVQCAWPHPKYANYGVEETEGVGCFLYPLFRGEFVTLLCILHLSMPYPNSEVNFDFHALLPL